MKNEEQFQKWLEKGIKQGWCSSTFCSTHDLPPYTAEEDEEWNAGHDPCIHMIRLFWTKKEQQDAFEHSGHPTI